MPEGAKPALRKVCGVTCPEDAVHAARAGANAIGLIFAPRSPRCLSPERAREIGEALPEGVLRVGVFVSESPQFVADTARLAGLDVVQLHGAETPSDCDAVRAASGEGIQVWKAVGIGSEFDAGSLSAYSVEAFLLDTAKDGASGGTGVTFSWHLAVPAKSHGRVVLAGGLAADNVAAAVRAVQPWGVDASSRLEASPGVKDPQKVASYLAAACSEG